MNPPLSGGIDWGEPGGVAGGRAPPLLENTRPVPRLAAGKLSTVAAITAPEDRRRRLLELGFVPGAPVAALQAAPWGDPVAYGVCGAVIALRRADARQIQVIP